MSRWSWIFLIILFEISILDFFETTKITEKKSPPPIPPNPYELLRKTKLEKEISFEENKNTSKQEIIDEPANKIIPSAPPMEDDDLKNFKNEDEDLCKICMLNELECVFYDCGHMICCMNCSKSLINCPVCRNKIIQSIKVYK